MDKTTPPPTGSPDNTEVEAPIVLPKANIREYDQFLNNLTAADTFSALDKDEKLAHLIGLRDKYKETHELDEIDTRTIDSYTHARSDFVKGDRYRVTPEKFKETGIEFPDIDGMPVNDALGKINTFREQAEVASDMFDPIVRDDYKHDLLGVANELERKARGQDTTIVADKGYRFTQGMVGGLMRSLGKDDWADDFEAAYLPENPNFDEDYSSKFATAAGDFVTTIGLIAGATLTAGPAAGASVGLATNSIRKYQENYKRQFDLTGDDYSAHDAGIAGIPGAFFETIGDLIVSGKLLKGVASPAMREAYSAAKTSAARAAIIKEAMKDAGFRQRVAKNYVEGFGYESISESGGDEISGRGGYAATGDRRFIPSWQQRFDSFTIGGLLGGGVSAARAAMQKTDPIFNKDSLPMMRKALKDSDDAGLIQAFEASAVAVYKAEAAKAADKPNDKPADAQLNIELEPIVQPSNFEVKSDGSKFHTIKNRKGETVELDDDTAKRHNTLVSLLSTANELDEINALPKGKKKGERGNIAIQKQYKIKNNALGVVENSLNEMIPERAAQFAQIDAAAAEAKIETPQVELFKRSIDAATLAGIQNGVPANQIYAGMSFQTDKMSFTNKPKEKAPVDPNAPATQDAPVEPVDLTGTMEALEAWDKANRGSRSDEWFLGGNANEDAITGYDEAMANGGESIQAHGMSKEATLTGAIRNLTGLLQNGLDKDRRGGRLDTAPLVAKSGEGLVGATASGTAYKDGPFTLLAKAGEQLSGDLSGLGAVIINQANVEQADAIKKQIAAVRPDLIVGMASEAGTITKQLLNPINSTVGNEGTFDQNNPDMLKQVKDIQKLADETGRNDIAMFANSFQQLIKGPDKTEEDVNRISKAFLDDMALNIANYVPRSEELVITADAYLTMEDGTAFDPSNPIHANTATPAQWQIHEAKNSGRLNDVLMKEQEAVYDERVSELGAGLLPYLMENVAIPDNGPSYTFPEAALIALASSKFGYTIRKSSNADGFEVNVVNIAANNRVSIPITDGMMASELGDIIQSQPNIKLKDAFKIAVTNATRKAQQENLNVGNSGWVTFEKSDTQEDAIKLNKACAGTSWCTGGAVSTAQSHLSGGNFYVYFKDGQAEVAIRTHDGRIQEVAGNTPKQDPLPWMNEEAEKFITEDAARFTGAEGFIEDRNIDRLIDKILKDEPYDIKELARFYTADTDRFIVELPKRNFNGHGDRNRPQVVKDAVTEKTSKYNANEILGGNIAPAGNYDIGNAQMLKVLTEAKEIAGNVSLSRYTYGGGSYITLNAEKAKGIMTTVLNPDRLGYTLIAPNLKEVSNIEVGKGIHVQLPNLSRTVESIRIDTGAIGIAAPKLEGVLRLYIYSKNNVTLPALTILGDATLARDVSLTLPALKNSSGLFRLGESSKLIAESLRSAGSIHAHMSSSVEAPKLKRMVSLDLSSRNFYGDDMDRISFPSVKRINHISLENGEFNEETLPSLIEFQNIKLIYATAEFNNLDKLIIGMFDKTSSIDLSGNSFLYVNSLEGNDDLTIELSGGSKLFADKLKKAKRLQVFNASFRLPSLETLSLGIDINSGNDNVDLPKLREVFTLADDDFYSGTINIKAGKVDLNSYEKGARSIILDLRGSAYMSSLEDISKNAFVQEEDYSVDLYVGPYTRLVAPKLKDQKNDARIFGKLQAPLIEKPIMWNIREEAEIVGKNGAVFTNIDGRYPAEEKLSQMDESGQNADQLNNKSQARPSVNYKSPPKENKAYTESPEIQQYWPLLQELQELQDFGQLTVEKIQEWKDNNKEAYEALKKAKRLILLNNGYGPSILYNGFRFDENNHPGYVYTTDAVNNVGSASIGFYLSNEKEVAQDYADQKIKNDDRVGMVNEVAVNVKKPLKFDKEKYTGNELISFLEEKGVDIPADIKDRWTWWHTDGLSHNAYVWKWINPSHQQRGMEWGDQLVDAIRDAGFDHIQHKDNSGALYEVGQDATSTVIFRDESNRIKSVDPIAFDESGNLIQPDQWGDSTSDSILYQKNDQLNNKSEDAPITGEIYYNDQLKHGGTFSGTAATVKPSKEGAYGYGFYTTPDTERARGYAKEKGEGNLITTFSVLLESPIVVRKESNSDFVEAKIFEALGVETERAYAMAERIIEDKGYIGKEFHSRGKKLGHDGIIVLNQDGSVNEVIAWDREALNVESEEIAQRMKNAQDKKKGVEQGAIYFEDAKGKRKPIKASIKELDQNLRAVITIMSEGGNISTFHHEAFHYYHRSGLLAQMLTPQEFNAFEKAIGVTNGITKEENYEVGARAYEAWLRNPAKPSKKNPNPLPPLVQSAFSKIADAMKNLYKSLKNSPLPHKLNKTGGAVSSINPAFSKAFEALYGFTPNKATQPNIKSPTDTQANEQGSISPQLPPVNAQLTQEGDQVSTPIEDANVTEGQLNSYEPDEGEDKSNQLNIKLINKYEPATQMDSVAKDLFKDILDLKAGLHNDGGLAGMFYAVTQNFARSRKFSERQDSAPEFRTNEANYIDEKSITPFIKEPTDPGYTQSVIHLLGDIKAKAFDLWFAQYAEKNEAMEGTSPDQFSSKADVIKFNRDAKAEKEAGSEAEEDVKRIAINDNVARAQVALRGRDRNTLPKANSEALSATIQRYATFLQDFKIESEEVSNMDAFQIQFALDTLLNDDHIVDLELLAKHEQMAFVGELTGFEKWRDAYSRFGLVGVLNAVFNRDAGSTFTNLSLFSANIEKVTANTPALEALNKFFAPYYQAVGEARVKKAEFKKFITDLGNKWGGDARGPEFMNRAGIISKLIQVPLDTDVDQRNEGLRINIEQYAIGIANVVNQGGNVGKAGQRIADMFKEITTGAPLEHEAFISYIQEKYPNHFGYINEASQWIANNLTDDARLVSEGLYNTPFFKQLYYLPTSLVRLQEPLQNDIDIDNSYIVNGDGSNNFVNKNVITVSRTSALHDRVGFIPTGENAGKYAYAANLEAILLKSVDGVINDIYTGYERKLLSALNPSKGGIYDILAGILSGDGPMNESRIHHLQRVTHGMVSSDLNQHAYIQPLEMLGNTIRRNIAPAMLSSMHQIVSQPLSQWTAHLARRPELFKYYGKALQMMSEYRDHSQAYDKDHNGFNEVMDRTLIDRAPAQDPLLAKGQTSQQLTAFDDLMLSQFLKESDKLQAFKNKFKKVHEKTKNMLLWGLRTGDIFSADIIFAAELIKLGAEQQDTSDPTRIDFKSISAKEIHKSVGYMDEAINASSNSRRGMFLAHPSIAMSLLTIFAGHRISIASSTSLRLRNIVDLVASGETSDPMFADSMKYARATVAQSVMFTSVKFALMAGIVKGLYQALTPDEDDERHWLYGELEKEEVQKIRKLADESYQRAYGEDVFTTNVIRDLFGNIVMVTAFGGIDNAVFTIGDRMRKEDYDAGKAEAIDQITKQMQAKAEYLTQAQLDDYKNQIAAIEATKFVPMGFKSFGADDLGGGMGAAAAPYIEGVTALTDIPAETKVFTLSELTLMLRTIGVGQPEITKALKFDAKVKDMLQGEAVKEELPDFDL